MPEQLPLKRLNCHHPKRREAVMAINEFAGYSPQQVNEIIRARKEMLNHIGQRVYHLPRQTMAAWKHASPQGRPRKAWRDLIRADHAPRRALYMPGKR